MRYDLYQDVTGTGTGDHADQFDTLEGAVVAGEAMWTPEVGYIVIAVKDNLDSGEVVAVKKPTHPEFYSDFRENDYSPDEWDPIETSERFADPGGTSALRAATPTNPRNRPCPTCGAPNRLTPKDVALGYRCDRCADAVERGVDL